MIILSWCRVQPADNIDDELLEFRFDGGCFFDDGAE